MKLHYVRDKEKREVDFLITEKNRPVCLIEAKENDEECSKNLLCYQEGLKVPVAVQVLHKGGIEKKLSKNGATQWIVSADKFLSVLP